MKYVCECATCAEQKSFARYDVGQEVIFACPVLGVRMEINGVIKEVVRKFRTYEVSYRIFVGKDSRLKHQNCIYGGIPDKNVLRLAEPAEKNRP